ncbi:MAG TPA: enoyl-CoA hydratase-related protein [Roseiflexaceae bacterium]|nr:enoyl-CoA hydratase-related protein [Roseiflexaceae bacterium]
MSDETTILYELADGVATITLNRPQVYNAFNERMHAELRQALTQAERDAAVRSIVITGAGKAFCSGQDIKDVPLDGTRSLSNSVRERYNPLVLHLRRIPKPVVAAVNGVAAGAGFSLAVACDMRIAAEGARFVAAFVNIGLVPDTGLTYFLPRLIGPTRAAELCMLGGQLDAPTALSYGMLNRVVPAEELSAAARELAARLADGPAQALSLIKRGLELSHSATLEQVLDYEAQAQQIAGTSPEYREGVSAFREKRPAKFRG